MMSTAPPNEDSEPGPHRPGWLQHWSLPVLIGIAVSMALLQLLLWLMEVRSPEGRGAVPVVEILPLQVPATAAAPASRSPAPLPAPVPPASAPHEPASQAPRAIPPEPRRALPPPLPDPAPVAAAAPETRSLPPSAAKPVAAESETASSSGAQAAASPAVASVKGVNADSAPARPGADRELAVLRRVTPRYPMHARRRGTEGYVVVEFTVDTAGTARDLRVADSAPQGVFEAAALAAVQEFEFAPRLRAGEPVPTPNVRNRFRFTLDGGR